ncbi:AAA family ATPase [Tistrella bauzanensis]|uniref:AAA family ATPase n=1 Tax=Tistrella TaxID=171436 RepID=UPI0031F678CB
MRLLRLSGRNLASLSGAFEIDFEAAPLVHAGIMAITGPTGAGKSTLLDAICLALYDAVPRSAGAGRIDGQDIQITDGRRVMSHGAGESEAEIDFAGGDGRRYRATWRVRRARGKADGSVQASSRLLIDIDSGNVIANQKKEVAAEIIRLIGLDFDQFRRAVLLAQGEFDAFLRAEPKLRAELLEKITGTAIYGALSRAAHDRDRQARAGIAAIEARLGEHRPMTAEDRAGAEAAAAATRDMAATAARAQAEAADRLRRVEQRLALARARDTAAAILAEAAAADRAADPDRAALDRDRRAFALRADCNAADDAVARHSVAHAAEAEAAERVTAAEAAVAAADITRDTACAARDAAIDAARAVAPAIAQARLLDSRIADATAAATEAGAEAQRADAHAAEAAEAARRIDAAIAATTQRHAAATADLARHQQAAPALADRAAVLALIDERAPLAAMQAERAAAIAALDREDAADTRRLATLTAERDARAAQLDLIAPALTAAEAAADQDAARDLRDRLDRLGMIASLVDSLRDGIVDAAEALRRSDGLQAQLVAVDAAITAAAARNAAATAALPVSEARLDEATRARDLSDATADDHARRLRALLIPGAPCPVCGSTDHQPQRVEPAQRVEPDAAGDLLAARLAKDRARVRALGAEVNRLHGEIAAAGARHGDERRRRAEIEAAIADTTDTLARIASDHDQVLLTLDAAAAEAGLTQAPLLPVDLQATARCPTPTVLADDWQDLVAHEATAARARLAAIDQAMAEARDLRDRRDTLLADRDAGAARIAAITAQTAERRAMRARLDQHRADLAAQAVRIDARLASLLDAAIPDWPQRIVADAAGFADALRTAGEAIDHARQQLAAAEADLARLAPELAAARATAQAAADRRQAAITQAGRLAAARDDLLAQRAACLDGHPADAVATAHDDACTATAAQAEAATAEAEAARRTLAVIAEARRGAAQAAETARHGASATQAALEAACAAIGCDVDTVRAVIARGGVAIDAEAERLAALTRAVGDARATLAARASDLDRHLADRATIAAGADTATIDMAAEACDAAQAARDLADDRLRQALQVIAADDAVRQTAGALDAELVAARQAAQVWANLDELIGSADGTRFRRYAQSLTLDRLLAGANRHLAELHPRYALRRMAGSDMALEVIDHDMADEARAVHNLSGGERFLVSLALALGLADISAGRGLGIESLFIDEGFGALDPQSLGLAISMLERLQATGRRVTVISHVEALKDRIPVQIQVVPQGGGRSAIRVVAG